MPAVEDQPFLAVEDHPMPANENQSGPAVKDHPVPAVVDHPMPADENQSVPAVEDHPMPAVEDEPVPAVEDQPVLAVEDQPVRTPIPEENGIPSLTIKVHTIDNCETVQAVAISNLIKHVVYTGGLGYVKIWDITQQQILLENPLCEIDCLTMFGSVTALKLSSDERTLIVGGDSDTIDIVDLTFPAPRIKGRLTQQDLTYSAIAISPDSKAVFSCCHGGDVAVFDINNQVMTRRFQGHTANPTCIDVSPDGKILWTGGFDNTVRLWDVKEGRQIQQYDFPSPIHSLALSSTGEWLAVGMRNSLIEVLNVNFPEKHQIRHGHHAPVLSLKFASGGEWFVSTGDDNVWNSYRTPHGASISKFHEAAPVLCCDISADREYIVTGSLSGEAGVHKVFYP